MMRTSNRIGEKGAIMISESLKVNTKLHYLDLGSNELKRRNIYLILTQEKKMNR